MLEKVVAAIKDSLANTIGLAFFNLGYCYIACIVVRINRLLRLV